MHPDGGGIRGTSSLLILERIMEKIREVQHLDYVPRPCDYFDLIGGTNTGGYVCICAIHKVCPLKYYKDHRYHARSSCNDRR